MPAHEHVRHMDKVARNYPRMAATLDDAEMILATYLYSDVLQERAEAEKRLPKLLEVIQDRLKEVNADRSTNAVWRFHCSYKESQKPLARHGDRDWLLWLSRKFSDVDGQVTLQEVKSDAQKKVHSS